MSTRTNLSAYVHTAIGATVLALEVLLAGCSQEAKEPQPLVAVQVAPVKQASISQVVTGDAVLYAINQAAITPKIAAPVQKFLVQRGAKVHRGQLLAVLENRDLAAAAEENRGNFEQAQASYATTTAASVPEEMQKAELDVKSTKEALDAQQKIYDSRQDLFKQGAIPRKDLDQSAVALVQARSQYEVAQNHLASLQAVSRQQALKSASGQLKAAEGKYHGAEAQLQYSEIRSPIDGVVTDRSLYAGEAPQAGAPLITVMDLSLIIAKAHLPQTQATMLKKGDEATLAVPGLEQEVKGKVTLISPALDPNSTTVEVWIQAPNPDLVLKPGSTARISIVARTVPDAVVVPAPALLTDEEGKKSVMVVGSDGIAHKRQVETGIQNGDAVQIVSGVKPGEQVVSNGAYGLPDKTKVKVEPGPTSAAQEQGGGQP